MEISFDTDGKVVSVVTVGAGYGKAIRSRLRKQSDGSFAGTRQYMEAAPVGYRGATAPVEISAELIEKARRFLASRGYDCGTVDVYTDTGHMVLL